MTARERKAVRWIKSKGSVTATMLVEWDQRIPGEKFFEWDDTACGIEYRLYQARLWLNRFRTRINGFRVRSFIHLDQDAEQGIPEGAYYPVEEISATLSMRQAVIDDITKRIESLGKELKFWKLTEAERKVVLSRLEASLV